GQSVQTDQCHRALLDQNGCPDVGDLPELVDLMVVDGHAALRPVYAGTGAMPVNFDKPAEGRMHRRHSECAFRIHNGVVFSMADQFETSTALGVVSRGIVQDERLVESTPRILGNNVKNALRCAPVVRLQDAAPLLFVGERVHAEIGGKLLDQLSSPVDVEFLLRLGYTDPDVRNASLRYIPHIASFRLDLQPVIFLV